jgi:hypothetical protein
MEQTFVITSTSGESKATVTSTPCNGDSSFVSYRLTVDSQSRGGGVCKPADVHKMVVKWAKSMLIGVTSVKQA